MYRYQKMEELLNNFKQITPEKAVEILRNTDGLKGEKIGYGNEKAVNQLLAHHGIVFKPSELKVWVSSNPYQLGEFVCYDLNEVFNKFGNKNHEAPIKQTDLSIAKSSFLNSEAYKNYEKHRVLRREILDKIKNKEKIKEQTLHAFIRLNPDFWEVYYLVGKYYYQNKQYKQAKETLEICLTKEITTIPDRKNVEKKLKKTLRKM